MCFLATAQCLGCQRLNHRRDRCRSKENGASRPQRTNLVGGGRPHSLWGVTDEDVGAPGVALFAVIRDGIREQGRLCR